MHHYGILTALGEEGVLFNNPTQLTQIIQSNLKHITTHPYAFVVRCAADCKAYVNQTMDASNQRLADERPIAITTKEHDSDTDKISVVVAMCDSGNKETFLSTNTTKKRYAEIELAAQQLTGDIFKYLFVTKFETAEKCITALFLELERNEILSKGLSTDHQQSLKDMINTHHELMLAHPAEFIDKVSHDFQEYLQSLIEDKDTIKHKPKSGYYTNYPDEMKKTPNSSVTGPLRVQKRLAMYPYSPGD